MRGNRPSVVLRFEVEVLPTSDPESRGVSDEMEALHDELVRLLASAGYAGRSRVEVRKMIVPPSSLGSLEPENTTCPIAPPEADSA